jgi:hypothetical protein
MLDTLSIFSDREASCLCLIRPASVHIAALPLQPQGHSKVQQHCTVLAQCSLAQNLLTEDAAMTFTQLAVAASA